MRCGYCGSSLHPTGYCPKTAVGQANRAALGCSYCGSRAHNEAACPKLGRTIRPGGILLLDQGR